MTTPHPDHQRLTGHRLDEDAAMDTFTLRLPRWRFLRLFGRNPLVRTGDRIEALVLVFAVVVSLLAALIAAAAGTAVYDSRSHLYAAQAENRRTVTATVTGDKFVRHDTFGRTVTVPARWFAAGAEHTGAVSAPPKVKTGDSIDIWVAEDGSHIGPPLRTAFDAAVAAAVAIWFGVAIAAAALYAGTRILLNRARHARWQRELAVLLTATDSDR
ncbi:hypothetical protein [Mycobacterium sp.]|uniref:Rv1733c family protein n=1 Tax=Mycobacterium sp. TaxID=1785 RepID=UPI0039C9C28B